MKNIIIKDKKDLLNNLFLYKSMIYKNVYFISEIDDIEVKEIIDALNIKKRNERIVFIYDYLCKKLDMYYEGKNVCGFDNNQCIGHRHEDCKYNNGCCRLCKYQSTEGCTTSNLTCKLFYCTKVREKEKIIEYKDLNILRLFNLRQRLMLRNDFFSSREEVLFDLKYSLIVLYSIRILYRIIRNVYLVKKYNLNNEKEKNKEEI